MKPCAPARDERTSDAARPPPHLDDEKNRRPVPGEGGRPRANPIRGGVGMIGFANPLWEGHQRDVAVAAAGRVSPSAIHALGSVCDWRFTKR